MFGVGAKTNLEGSEAELKDEPLPLADILRREGEHSVVNTKQGDEKESGACQTPEHTHTQNKYFHLILLTCTVQIYFCAS